MNRLGIKLKFSTRVTYSLALALIFGIAFFIRVYFPYDNVFAGDWVRFQINDPWYHMRVIENLVQNFPHRMPFDSYGFYPSGQEVVTAPFFDWLIGFFIWVFGAGSPSPRMIETLGAYFPAILGALVTVPVYFIGKELFNRKAGVLAAALIAILPGEFLMRSLLGFTDHHVAEVLFSAITMMFLILAVKSSRQKEISFNSLWRKDWGSLRKPLIYSLLTGIALGVYLLSWTGGALFIFIIFVFAVLQYVIDHLRSRSTDYLCIIGVLSFLIALLMVAPASGQYSLGSLQVSSLVIGIAAFLALSGVSFLMVRRSIRPAYYPLALAVLVGIGYGLFYLTDPSLLDSMVDKVGVLSPAGGKATIAETKGLSSLSSIWNNFTTGFYLSLISLGMMAYLVIKEGAAEKTLLLVWGVIMLIATVLGQARFAYYFAVNVSLLTAYFSWRVLEFAGFSEASEGVKSEEFDRSVRLQTYKKKDKLSKKAKHKKEKARKREQGTLITRYLSAKYTYGLIALIVVFFLAFFPNIGKSIEWAKPQRGPSDDWHEALVWMGENTPEPFKKADYYYELYRTRIPRGHTDIDMLFQEGTGDPLELDSQVVEEQYTTGDKRISLEVVRHIAQTFTPSRTHSIQFVKIKAYRLGSPAAVEVQIQGTNEHGHPDGVILTSGGINAEEFTDDLDGAWYTIGVNSYPLSAGVKYAIVVKGSDYDRSNTVRWMADTPTNGYAGGNSECEFVTNPASSWTSYSGFTGYGVMSWWDYGYWITYIAHRVPNANPSGSRNAKEAGLFFTALDESSANGVLDSLGSKYVIIDYSMATGKFYAMIEWAEKDKEDFFEAYYDPQTGKGMLLYHVSYYQSMCSRLYNFGGQEWIPAETTVISYKEEELTDIKGKKFRARVITDFQSFVNYDEAKTFVDEHPSYLIVGADPFVSPVPLEKLEHYELRYKSPTIAVTRGEETISRVEVFERFP